MRVWLRLEVRLASLVGVSSPPPKMTQELMRQIATAQLECPGVFSVLSLHDLLAAFGGIPHGDLPPINTPGTVNGDTAAYGNIITNFDPSPYDLAVLSQNVACIREAIKRAERFH